MGRVGDTKTLANPSGQAGPYRIKAPVLPLRLQRRHDQIATPRGVVQTFEH